MAIKSKMTNSRKLPRASGSSHPETEKIVSEVSLLKEKQYFLESVLYQQQREFIFSDLRIMIVVLFMGFLAQFFLGLLGHSETLSYIFWGLVAGVLAFTIFKYYKLRRYKAKTEEQINKISILIRSQEKELYQQIDNHLKETIEKTVNVNLSTSNT